MIRKLKKPSDDFIYGEWNRYYPDNPMPDKGFILLHRDGDRWNNIKWNLRKVKDKRTYRKNNER